MHPIRKIIYCLLLLLAGNTVFGQPFPCNGDLYFATNSNNGRNSLNRIFFIPFTGLAFARDRFYGGADFNALGFNSGDGYIYAARLNSNEIVRLKKDNTFEVVGEVPNLERLTTSAGDCTPDGYYLVHDQVLDQILVFEVLDEFGLVNRIDLFWDPASDFSGPFTARIDDFAIDPTDPTVAYSYQGDYFDPDLQPDEARGYFLKINLDFQSPDLGMVTPVAPISRNIIKKIGSLFFSAPGTLYAYGSTLSGPDPIQNKIMTINKNTGDITEFNRNGPEGINSDGCSCPYGLSFTNRVDPNNALCTDAKVTYYLTITNWFFQGFPNTAIADTLPEGMIITNISGNFTGDIEPGTGVGTRILQLNNLDIPPKSSITLNMEVEIIDLPIDFVTHQAILTNLPERLGWELVSDDPATVGNLGDATTLNSEAQRLTDFTIELSHPNDCLEAMTGKMVISAPVFIPGIEYEIRMQNEKYAEFTRNAFVDEQNTMVIDSLLPGEYRLYSIRPNNANCSFAMKDTTVAIIAPNELINAEVFTNSPVCEGTILELSGAVFPAEGGAVKWKGPAGVWSDVLLIRIDSILANQSGTYKMTFTYGYCEQLRELEVEVFPRIEAQITSPDGICERDSLQIVVEGQGNIQSFKWRTPEGGQHGDSLLAIPSSQLKDEGLYEVILDNGQCQDTAQKYIQVYPAPTLELPRVEVSKFCDPLVLSPQLSGNTNVSYSWKPEEGLSCADCPTPEIEAPVQPDYTLTVRTRFACQDSAKVRVLLDEEGLIYIPNVFSPNNDNVNDYFQVFPSCGVASIDQFEIFDRYGSLVYQASSITQFYDRSLFWDGQVNNSPLSDGLFIWRMELSLIDGTNRRLKGEVKVLR